MKKYILSLMFCAMCANVFAQYDESTVVRRDRADKIEYMTYRNISFENSLEDFRSALKAQGYEFNSEDPNNERMYLSADGEVAGTESVLGLELKYDSKIKKVTSVVGPFYSNMKSEAETQYASIINNIRATYPNAVPHFARYIDEYGCEIQHYSWDVYSYGKSYIVGQISVHVSLDPGADHSVYMADVEYKDMNNSQQSENLEYGNFDITDFLPSDYDQGYVFLDASQLQIFVEKNGQWGCATAFYDDRRNIVEMTLDEKLSLNEKRSQLGKYLNSLPIFTSQNVCCTRQCFNNSEYNYAMGKEYREMRNTDPREEEQSYSPYNVNSKSATTSKSTQKSTSSTQKYGVYDFLMGIVFNKEDLEFQKKHGIYDTVKGAMKGIMTGSGSGSTQWDLLSPSQKAIIHEHDNAR